MKPRVWVRIVRSMIPENVGRNVPVESHIPSVELSMDTVTGEVKKCRSYMVCRGEEYRTKPGPYSTPGARVSFPVDRVELYGPQMWPILEERDGRDSQ